MRPLRSFSFLLFFLTLLSVSLSGIGATTLVPQDYATIQAAIDASTDGDEIIVSPGTYLENIHFNGKNIILRSTDPTNPDVVTGTVIDGNQAGSVVTFYGTELNTCILSGFTITNGSAADGGGINGHETLSTIQNNTITGNSAGDNGGGLYRCDGIIQNSTISGNSAGFGGGLHTCRGTVQNNSISGNSASSGGGLSGCYAIIQDNTISGNSAVSGGGLYRCDGIIQNSTISGNSAGYGGGLDYCDGTIQHNTILGNSASADGAGLCCCDGTIQNNTISGNSAGQLGGGLLFCEGTIQNNTITGNSAQAGGGLYWCDDIIQNNTILGNSAQAGGGLFGARGTIRNCIIWGNSATDGPHLYDSSIPLYSCIEGWTGEGIGNISSDPLFVDSANEDYHLQAGSPCIDAGVSGYWFSWPQWDRDGNCRLAGSSVDMGCYEYGSQPDSDGDLLSDNEEALHGTDPNVADHDGDGLRDGLEIIRGSDPLSLTPAGVLNVPSAIPMIQLALAVCQEGDEIVVAPGVYYENLECYGPDVVLRGLDPSNPVTVSETIIDGSRWSSVVTFAGVETSLCILSGFTISNGSAVIGGGINGQGSNATIEHCLITGNSASRGGGLYCCDGIIQSNTIAGNSADYDGGGLFSCKAMIQNNSITGNAASWYGGGLSSCNGTIQNNTITGNSAQFGGGLGSCMADIMNCIITSNENYGIYEDPIDGDPDEVRYSNLYGNILGDYFDADTGTVYNGTAINELPEVHDCISTDSLFVDPANGDFHLQDVSPCIDAGDPEPQYYDGCRPPGKGTERNDMGAYGGPENCGWLRLSNWNFDSTQHNWQFETLSPGPHHVEHWEDGFPTTDTRSIGISSPYDESTNYFALWSSVNADPIPYYDNALYQVDWLFSTNRQSTNCVPSVRFRVGLKNQKAFSFSRIYPGEWLPLAQRPGATLFPLFFGPPIASPEGLFLAFALIDWTDDFRQSSPAGSVYLEEVSVYRYYLDEFTDWQELLSLEPADLVDWQSSTAPPYDEPSFLYDANGLSITSTIPAERVFGCWNSPSIFFTIEPSKLYRLRSNVSSGPQLGGPELRLRVHTDNYRYAWYNYYVSSYTAEETALPAVAGADCHLYFSLPFATQPCHVSFDLIDFSDIFGGTLTLHNLALHAHAF